MASWGLGDWVGVVAVLVLVLVGEEGEEDGGEGVEGGGGVELVGVDESEVAGTTDVLSTVGASELLAIGGVGAEAIEVLSVVGRADVASAVPCVGWPRMTGLPLYAACM